MSNKKKAAIMVSGSSAQSLQAAIAGASSTGPNLDSYAHHPITCPSKLEYHEDGSFNCEHSVAPPDDVRSQQCITHSIALLIIELAQNF